MENKKTTELLDLYKTLIDKDGNILDREKYDDWWEIIKLREPFYGILHEDAENSISTLRENIDYLTVELRKLRRHKHDEKTGDVLIRI